MSENGTYEPDGFDGHDSVTVDVIVKRLIGEYVLSVDKIITDIICGTTPSYIVDFTDNGIDVANITKTTLIVWGELNFS